MIKDLIEISIKAGEAIEEVARNSFDVTIKEDKTPVTQADYASHNLIVEELAKRFPDIPVLSEESDEISLEERQSWNKYFLIDPLDGTKEFIKQNGQYSVLVSLMENNRPILGIVHSPTTKDTWYAELGKGAFKQDPQGNTTPLKVKSFEGGEVNVAVSASHLTQVTIDYMEEHFKTYKTHPIGSAIKFCKIAEGLVDVYPRLGPTSEWDTSAGELILSEAGGGVIQFENKDLLEYNKVSLRNPWFIAFGTKLEKLN